MDDRESAVDAGEAEFWNRLAQLETEHRRVQHEHEAARRELDSAKREQVDELMRVWSSYCKVLEQLDLTAAALEKLGHEAPGQAGSSCEAGRMPEDAAARTPLPGS